MGHEMVGPRGVTLFMPPDIEMLPMALKSKHKLLKLSSFCGHANPHQRYFLDSPSVCPRSLTVIGMPMAFSYLQCPVMNVFFMPIFLESTLVRQKKSLAQKNTDSILALSMEFLIFSDIFSLKVPFEFLIHAATKKSVHEKCALFLAFMWKPC